MDKYFINTDHLLFYHNMAGIYLWIKEEVGSKNKREFRGQVGMSNNKKDYFTVQLTISKDRAKLKSYVIFKGVPFNSTREYYRRTIAYELLN